MKAHWQRPLLSAKHLTAILCLAFLSSQSSAAEGPQVSEEKQASDEPSEDLQALIDGRRVLEDGDPQRAIKEFFDPVIQHYESVYSRSDSTIYSAQNMQQAVLYAALPGDGKQAVEVTDSTWADAYLMKAYALIELKKVEQAEPVLEKAIALSPMSSQYLSELAYVYQVEGDCGKSIATYEKAEAAADLGSDDETKTSDSTRALRGQGYCLVEQGKLDEAEAMYRKALAVDPSDSRSSAELEYIENLRKK